MRVRSILREPLAIQHRGSGVEQQRAIAKLLDEVGLSGSALDKYPHEFSGGQRQRIGLARALALRPKLIVADEPVSALDVSVQAQILNLMRDLQREHQLTYVFISHDLSVVRYVSTTIGVMYLGKLVEIGPAEQVYTSPAHPYTRGLIDTIPLADPEREQRKDSAGVRGELPSAMNPPSGCRFRTRLPLPATTASIKPAVGCLTGSTVAGAGFSPPVDLAVGRSRQHRPRWRYRSRSGIREPAPGPPARREAHRDRAEHEAEPTVDPPGHCRRMQPYGPSMRWQLVDQCPCFGRWPLIEPRATTPTGSSPTV